MSAIPAAAAVETPDRQQAQQEAQQELSQGKYQAQPSPTPPPSSASPSPSATSASPSPTPTQNQSSSHGSSATTVLLVILLVVVVGTALLLVLRKFGKPRKDGGKKKDGEKPAVRKGRHQAGGAAEIPLYGAALHRHNAEQAARGGDWQEAIRERFRAVIAVLDERALLPERPDRTADEAAADAGELLPEHAQALADSARAFDEVEYGEYLGTPAGYEVIGEVDRAISESARQQAVSGR